MNRTERSREIEEARRNQEAEPEIEGGHEEISGGYERPPGEQADEFSAPSMGKAELIAEEIQTERPGGGAAVPQEVQGFEPHEQRHR